MYQWTPLSLNRTNYELLSLERGIYINYVFYKQDEHCIKGTQKIKM